MKPTFGIVLFSAFICIVSSLVDAQQLNKMGEEITLPAPQLSGKVSLEHTISRRRSRRNFRPKGLSLTQISQLLWSAQGITDQQRGLRAAPSAGALYPIEIYLLNQEGLHHYIPQGHKLKFVLRDDLRRSLAAAALRQNFIAQAPVDIVIAADYEKVTCRYGLRGKRYTDIEAGHIAQNVHLQAVALGLASVPVGAFDEQAVRELLRLSDDEQPLYIIPVGYAADD